MVRRAGRSLMPSRLDVLRLAYLAVAIALPIALVGVLWPQEGAAGGGWKVVAILAGATLFVAMKGFYAWVCLRQTQIELGEPRK
jgi:hypothetical protein